METKDFYCLFQLRDGFQDQFKKSFEPIELEAHLREEEYDAENVTVQIVELDPEEISKSNNWIGANKPVYDGDQNSDVGESDSGVDDNDDNEEDDVPGFTVTSTKVRRKPATHNENTVANVNGGDDHEAAQVEKKAKKLREDFKSKRAMGQYMAKQAQNTLKHSKAYQMKNKLERIRNKKKARIEKEKRIKLQNKREKHKKNSAKPSKPSKFSKKGKSQRK